ncbi:MAG: hypothetical protein ABI041_08985 [Bdellovibrionia bacterium]
MPSFNEIVGVIVSFVVLSTASGHGDWVWKGIIYTQHAAMKQARSNWGCPSIKFRSACSEYDPARYR